MAKAPPQAESQKREIPHHALEPGVMPVGLLNPNVAEIFGPKALRSLYIRPSRNDCPFSRPHRMFNTLSSLKMLKRPLLTQSIPF